MAVRTRVFLDTSVLVAGLIDFGDISVHPQAIMDAVAHGHLRKPATAWHCCLEFYSVATRLPEEFRLAPADALRLVESEVLGRLTVHQIPEERFGAFLSEAAHRGTAGGRIYDEHVAEVARSCGAHVVITANRRHFTSLLPHGVRVLTAAEFAAAL